MNPLTIKKIRRFKSIKRGYYSFILILVLILASFFAEILVNKRAVLVSYNGAYYFPTYGDPIPGSTFGLEEPAAKASCCSIAENANAPNPAPAVCRNSRRDEGEV